MAGRLCITIRVGSPKSQLTWSKHRQCKVCREAVCIASSSHALPQPRFGGCCESKPHFISGKTCIQKLPLTGKQVRWHKVNSYATMNMATEKLKCDIINRGKFDVMGSKPIENAQPLARVAMQMLKPTANCRINKMRTMFLVYKNIV
jgi:hypothetical protein